MLRRLWSWSLACALLLAQTLGAMHGAAHARGPLLPAAQAQSQSQSQSQAKSFVAGLFKAHDDGGGCRLFDQLSHGDAAAPAAAGIVLPLPSEAPACPVVATAAASPTLGGLARAPPVLA